MSETTNELQLFGKAINQRSYSMGVFEDETVLYRSIVEESAIGVYIADRATRTNLYINEAFCSLCGFESAKVSGKKLDDILQMYDKEELVTKEAIASLSFDKYSEFHSSRRGLYLTIKAKAVMWDHVDSYILYVTDETNEHRNQLNLEQTLMKEQTLMEAIPGGTAIYHAKKRRKNDRRICIRWILQNAGIFTGRDTCVPRYSGTGI